MPGRALVVINAKSRNGTGIAEEACAQLKRTGIEPHIHQCPRREDLPDLIVREGTDADLVIVGGGDGTINAAAEGLIAASRPLAILPLGTANDLARTLGIPADLESAVKVIAEGNIRAIDVGSVNDKLFFNVASVGLSAELAGEITNETKSILGKLAYAAAGLKVLSRARPFRATIIHGDTQASVRTLQIAVGNGRFYGGGNIVAPDAHIDDSHLHLYSLEVLRAWRLLLMMPAFRKGKHVAWNEVRALRSEKFEIHTRRPRTISADGEIVTKTPGFFRVIPRAIKVFAPSSDL